MTGTVLLILTTNFDDMAFLSCQVILEENSFDVIVASKERGTCRGGETSLMTVALEDALNQDIEYLGLVLIGGDDFTNWELVKQTVNEFQTKNLWIGSVTNTQNLILGSEQTDTSEPITVINKTVYLNSLDFAEQFAEQFAELLNS